jgi:hypothetical protein
MKEEYMMARLQRVLAEDDSELGIDMVRRGDHYVLIGEVESEERRQEVADKVAEHLPELEVRNEIMVTRFTKPVDHEMVSRAVREGE